MLAENREWQNSTPFKDGLLENLSFSVSVPFRYPSSIPATTTAGILSLLQDEDRQICVTEARAMRSFDGARRDARNEEETMKLEPFRSLQHLWNSPKGNFNLSSVYLDEISDTRSVIT